MHDIHEIGTAVRTGRSAAARSGGPVPFGPAGAPDAASRCLVCGSPEVSTDEVARDVREERLRVLLAECRHCDHRWTRPLPDEAAPRRAASVRRRPEREPAETAQGAEVASAA